MSRTVFVLSGGANLGAVQVGMLAALVDHGVVPDAVIGASVGAINATAFASDPTAAGVDRLARVWRNLRRGDVFPGSRLDRALAVARRRVHLLDPAPLRALIARWITIADLADTVVPLHAATTELRTGVIHWWTSGDPVEVLTASACLPCVFPPVELAGGLHIDGAVLSAVPLARAAAIGADVIYVLDAGATSRPAAGSPRSSLDVLLWTFRAARLARLEIERALVGASCRIEWLPPVDAGRLAFDDFSRTGALIDAGYLAASTHLRGHSLLAAG